MKRRSLAFRLTVILGGAWLALFLALGGAIWHTTQRLILEAQADKARALATQLATVSLDAVLLRDYGTLERYLGDLAGAVAYAEVRRADGQVLGKTGTRLPGIELLRVPMRAAGEEIGEVLAQYDPNPARRAAWQLAGLMALALAVFAALSFWALRRLLLRRLVAPVAALIEQADPELRDALTTIETQARRAGQIVRDMLTAARAPAPSLQVVDLGATCAAFVRLVTPLARKQGVGIDLVVNGSAMVSADASRVEQILFNLVFNAVQAGAHHIQLSLEPGEHPALVVGDDGPGLPESVRARLFEPFVTTKPAGQGTGLGLAISQRLAREMGAELALLESAHGTHFRLDFSPEPAA